VKRVLAEAAPTRESLVSALAAELAAADAVGGAYDGMQHINGYTDAAEVDTWLAAQTPPAANATPSASTPPADTTSQQQPAPAQGPGTDESAVDGASDKSFDDDSASPQTADLGDHYQDSADDAAAPPSPPLDGAGADAPAPPAEDSTASTSPLLDAPAPPTDAAASEPPGAPAADYEAAARASVAAQAAAAAEEEEQAEYNNDDAFDDYDDEDSVGDAAEVDAPGPAGVDADPGRLLFPAVERGAKLHRRLLRDTPSDAPPSEGADADAAADAPPSAQALALWSARLAAWLDADAPPPVLWQVEGIGSSELRLKRQCEALSSCAEVRSHKLSRSPRRVGARRALSVP